MSSPSAKPRALTVSSNFVPYLDALLLILFLLLLSPRLTGLSWHEIFGLLFVVPVIIHLLLARPWIINSLKRMFTPKDMRGRVNLVLNILLFILVFIEIISGLVISQVAMPYLGFTMINDRSWRALHNQTLNFTHLVLGFHIAMNWDWIVAVYRRMVAVRGPQNTSRLVLSPSFSIALGWTALVLVAITFVAFGAFTILGPPSASRIYFQNEIARFSPTVGHGLGQFMGETFLTAVVVYIGHKWLRIRL